MLHENGRTAEKVGRHKERDPVQQGNGDARPPAEPRRGLSHGMGRESAAPNRRLTQAGLFITEETEVAE